MRGTAKVCCYTFSGTELGCDGMKRPVLTCRIPYPTDQFVLSYARTKRSCSTTSGTLLTL
eukprot:3858383-Rhodomonas_salina.1